VRVTKTDLAGVLVIEPQVFTDARGFFFESFNARAFGQVTGERSEFVQDNHSCSGRNVLRGLHYQVKQPQAKLGRVVAGEIFDVTVDLRRASPTFGRWFGVRLSAQNKRQIWIPVGCAHGFIVLSGTAELLYKTTDYWAPEHERCILWNDPELAIDWPLQGAPRVSAKDARGTLFREADLFE